MDNDILDMARLVASKLNLVENSDYFIENRNLLNSMIRRDSLVVDVGENSQDIVDALGINEYFPDLLASRFLFNAYRCVKSGGALITSNMLIDRNQMQINKICICQVNSVDIYIS